MRGNRCWRCPPPLLLWARAVSSGQQSLDGTAHRLGSRRERVQDWARNRVSEQLKLQVITGEAHDSFKVLLNATYHLPPGGIASYQSIIKDLGSSAVPGLTRVLQNTSAVQAVRRRAAEALSLIGGHDAVRALVEQAVLSSATDPEASAIRSACMQALDAIPSWRPLAHDSIEVIASSRDWEFFTPERWQQLAEFLSFLGETGLPILARLAKHPYCTTELIALLEHIGTEKAIALLIEIGLHPASFLRDRRTIVTSVIAALKRSKNSDVVVKLSIQNILNDWRFFKDVLDTVAPQWLHDPGLKASIPRLLQNLKQAGGRHRSALLCLLQHGDEALAIARQHQDLRIRQSIFLGLRDAGYERAIMPLLETLQEAKAESLEQSLKLSPEDQSFALPTDIEPLLSIIDSPQSVYYGTLVRSWMLEIVYHYRASLSTPILGRLATIDDVTQYESGTDVNGIRQRNPTLTAARYYC